MKTVLLPLRLLLPLAFVPLTTASDKIDLTRVVPVAANEPIPVSDFFRPPIMQDLKVNPSGTHIAALVTSGSDKVQLLVFDLKAQKAEVVGGEANLDVGSFDWLGDHRLIYELSIQGEGSIGLVAANIEQLKNPYPILQFENESLVAVPKDDRIHPLIWTRFDATETGKQAGVVTVDTDITSGKIVNMTTVNSSSTDSELAKENNAKHVIKRYPLPGKEWVTEYLADQFGALDFAVTETNGVFKLHQLKGETWNDCSLDFDQIGIVGPGTKSGELAVVGPRGTGKPRTLQLMDGSTGRLGEVLIEDKEYDYNGDLYRDPGSRAIVGATFDRAGPQSVWFHPVYAKLQQLLNGFFPGLVVRIIGNDEKGGVVLVSTFSDRQPPVYQWVDLATNKVGLIKNSAPWIDPQRMRPMSVIKYKTRDGHRLDAYVTMPAGATKQNPPPLVVLPHDGPLARDSWGYRQEVQFLASRGYAVLQPNYRGSTGYSWMFPESDDWDYTRMSEDVTDATKTLVASGFVDSRRVAILGTSFGGYLALQGATSEPDLYRCAAAIGGIFDWESYVNDFKYNRFDNPEYDHWVHKLGEPSREKTKYEAMSPLRHIDRLRVPVFTAIGRDDAQFLVAQTNGLVSKLDRYKIPHETVTLGGIGYSMTYVSNRVEIYSRLESFLEKNLKDNPAPAPH